MTVEEELGQTTIEYGSLSYDLQVVEKQQAMRKARLSELFGRITELRSELMGQSVAASRTEPPALRVAPQDED